MTPDQHFGALTEELAEETATANNTPRGCRLIKILQNKIKQIVEPPAILTDQKVTEQEQRVRMQQQRVIDETPILTIPCITNAPPIMQSQNPTAKWALKDTPRLHRQVTRNNTLGAVLAIKRVPGIAATTHIHPEWREATNKGRKEEMQGVRRRLPRGRTTPPPTTFTAIPSRV